MGKEKQRGFFINETGDQLHVRRQTGDVRILPKKKAEKKPEKKKEPKKKTPWQEVMEHEAAKEARVIGCGEYEGVTPDGVTVRKIVYPNGVEQMSIIGGKTDEFDESQISWQRLTPESPLPTLSDPAERLFYILQREDQKKLQELKKKAKSAEL